MTYVFTIASSGSVGLTYPAACLTVDGIAIPCDQLDEAPSDAGTPTVACTPAGGGACNCTVNDPPQSHATQGTYSTAGNSIAAMSTTGNSIALEYCVQGSRLTLTLDSDNSSSGVRGVMAHLVLGKQ